VVCVLVVRVIGPIDRAAVRTALSLLTWWQPLVLLAVVLLRQVLGALPLALYIPGVSVFRATLNDLGAIPMSMVAPPPSDLALRVAMFTSWGVTAAKGPSPLSCSCCAAGRWPGCSARGPTERYAACAPASTPRRGRRHA